MLLTTSAAERATNMLAMAGSPDASATPAIGSMLVAAPGGLVTGGLTFGFALGSLIAICELRRILFSHQEL